MPRCIEIDGVKFYIDDNNPKVLRKKEANSKAKEDLVYSSEFGAFKDLIFKENIIFAIKEEGYIVSADLGETWTHFYEWADENMRGKTYYYDFFFKLLQLEIAARETARFTVSERINSIDYKSFDLFYLKNEASLDLFFAEIIKTRLKNDYLSAVFFHRSKKEAALSIKLENLKKGENKVHKKQLLENIDTNFLVIDLAQVEHAIIFLHNCIKLKRHHDIKGIIIPDLSFLFSADSSTEEVESFLQLLSSFTELLNINVISGFNKNSKLNKELVWAVERFNHPSLFKFRQRNEEDELVFTESL